MDSNDKLKEINIKNDMCYYFDDIIKIADFNLSKILLNERSLENILVCNILYKTLINAKPLLIRSDKIDEFIRVYDGTGYLVLTLFGSEKYDFILNRIRYLIKNNLHI